MRNGVDIEGSIPVLKEQKLIGEGKVLTRNNFRPLDNFQTTYLQ